MQTINAATVVLADGTKVTKEAFDAYTKTLVPKPRPIISYLEALSSGVYDIMPHFFELDDVLILAGLPATEENIALLQNTILEEIRLVVMTWFLDEIKLHDQSVVSRNVYERYWMEVRICDYLGLIKLKMFAEALKRGDAYLWEHQIRHLNMPRTEELDRLILNTSTNLDYPNRTGEEILELVEIQHMPIWAVPPAPMVQVIEYCDTLTQDVLVAMRIARHLRKPQISE